MPIDPFDLLRKSRNLQGVVKDLETQVATISRRNVSAGTLGELAPQVGQVSIANNGGVIDENGMSLSGGSMNIEFWASIGVPSNILTFIYAMVFSGTTLYVGGNFTKIGGINANYIAKYDTVTGVWSNVGSATALDSSVIAIAISGTDIYVGGTFTNAGGNANADYIAKWNGAAWSALGAASLNNYVNAITISGTDIYVGGNFTNADGLANADYIAKWNGAAWSALGTASLNGLVNAIAISGTDIYVGGYFTNADGLANADYIARWDGLAWAALGAASINQYVAAIAISGTDVYVGGSFTNADGNANADYIARWDGSAWAALDTGVSNNVYTIALYGNDVYLGGVFTEAGGRASKGVAAYLQTLESILAYLEVSGQALQDSLITGTNQYVPAGTVSAFAGGTAPTGYLLCNGAAVSRTTYSKLFAVCGTAYGVGDGSTTFNLPNLKGKVIVGYDAAQTEFDALGETGGAKTHTLTIAEMPSHNHSTLNSVAAGALWGATLNTATAQSGSVPTGYAGGGTAHNNLQPYTALNYIIKT